MHMKRLLKAGLARRPRLTRSRLVPGSASRAALMTTASTLVLLLAGALGHSASAQNAVRRDGTAFSANPIGRNDDGSTGMVSLGFGVNFFGTMADRVFVNNNGNITFGSALGGYTPASITGATSNPIIAAFYADVDTRDPGSAITSWGTGTVNGRNAFGVTWDGVGYYSRRADRTNVFQLLLVDRSDIGAGDFDIEYNYDRIQWETGDASGGVNGLGGTPALVGYASGSGVPGTFFQLPGSITSGAFLDGGPQSLVANRIGSDVNGRYVFNVRGGLVSEAPPLGPGTVVPEPGTYVLMATGLAGLVAVRRRVTA